MTRHLASAPELFTRLSDAEIDALGGEKGSEGWRKEKRVMEALRRNTEEGKKVERNDGGKQWSVWRRLETP